MATDNAGAALRYYIAVSMIVSLSTYRKAEGVDDYDRSNIAVAP